MTLFPKTCASLALMLGCSLAVAGPKEDLHAAFTKFLAAKSFRATATDLKKGEQVSKMEFVAPDRYRIDAGGRASLIVGDTMYMDIGGKMQPLPVPGVGRMVAQYRNPEFLGEMEAGMDVKALGNETVEGQATKVYAYTLTRPVKSDAKAWISVSTGLPMQIESTATFMGHAATTRVRYSDFDDPSIRIDAP
jgi:hypothetical protein